MGALRCDTCGRLLADCNKGADECDRYALARPCGETEPRSMRCESRPGALRPDLGATIACLDCDAPAGYVRAGCCDPGTGPEADPTLCACGAGPGEPCCDPCPVFDATASEPQPPDYEVAIAEAVNLTAAGYRRLHAGERIDPQPGLAALHAAARLATDPGKAITEALLALYSFTCSAQFVPNPSDARECKNYREAWADAVYSLAEAHAGHPLADLAIEASGL